MPAAKMSDSAGRHPSQHSVLLSMSTGLVRSTGNGGLTMKKWLATPLVVALLLLMAIPNYAWSGGTRVFVGVGVAPVWWGYPYWYYPPPPYYVYGPPTVVVQQSPVYVEQQPALPSPPAGSAPPPQEFWHYG